MRVAWGFPLAFLASAIALAAAPASLRPTVPTFTQQTAQGQVAVNGSPGGPRQELKDKLPCSKALKVPYPKFIYDGHPEGSEADLSIAGLYWGECQHQVNLHQMKGQPALITAMETLRARLNDVATTVTDLGGTTNGGGTSYWHSRPRTQVPEIELFIASLVASPPAGISLDTVRRVASAKARLALLADRLRHPNAADLASMPSPDDQKYWLSARHDYLAALDSLLAFVGSGQDQQSASILEFAKPKFLDRFTARYKKLSGPIGRLTAAALNPQGTLAAFGATNQLEAVPDVGAQVSVSVELRDVKTGQIRRRLQFAPSSMGNQQPFVTVLAFSHSGQLLAIGTEDGKLVVYDVTTGRVLLTRPVSNSIRPDAIMSLAWRPDGRSLALSLDGNDTIQLRNPGTGALISRLRGVPSGARAMVWKPDGSALAAPANDDRVHVFDAASGLQRFSFPAYDDYAIDWSPDGKLLATSFLEKGEYGQRTTPIDLHDAATGAKLRTLSGHGVTIAALRFSSDSKQMLSVAGHAYGVMEATMLLTNISTGEQVLTYSDPEELATLVTAGIGSEGQLVGLGWLEPNDQSFIGPAKTSILLLEAY